jgi:hypothetical protein
VYDAEGGYFDGLGALANSLIRVPGGILVGYHGKRPAWPQGLDHSREFTELVPRWRSWGGEYEQISQKAMNS